VWFLVSGRGKVEVSLSGVFCKSIKKKMMLVCKISRGQRKSNREETDRKEERAYYGRDLQVSHKEERAFS
jgi:hypothetical protein